MTTPPSHPPNSDDDPHQQDTPQSRLQLVWDVLVFQAKLMVDGLRDVFLVPVSLAAALLGLLIGGRKPARFFDAIIRFGRRSEAWINLFGHHKSGGTADDLVAPLQKRVMEEAQSNPILRKAGTTINRSLDKVEQAIVTNDAHSADESSSADLNTPNKN